MALLNPAPITITVILAIGGGVVLIVLAFWWFRRKSSQGRSNPAISGKSRERSPEDVAAPETEAKTEATEGAGRPDDETAAPLPSSERLGELASQVADPEIKDFLQELVDLVRELEPEIGPELPMDSIEELVDRFDDLRLLGENHREDAGVIGDFRQILIEILSAAEAEPIHSEKWNSSLQRAIAKEPRSDVEAPSILRFGSSGIRRHGKLLRKQEVVLAIPE